MLTLLWFFFLYFLQATRGQDGSGVVCDPRKNIGCEVQDYPSPLDKGHKCDDYVKRYRGDDTATIKLISSFRHEQNTLGKRPSRHHYTFFYVNGSEPGQEFLLCAMPKNGITRTMLLLMRVLGLQGDISQVQFPVMERMDPSVRERILQNSNIPRIKIVRNPYIRAVSMYKDKVLTLQRSNENGKYMGYQLEYDYIPSFGEFIETLIHKNEAKEYINRHFLPQHHHCWEQSGLDFDYILQLERMNYWYPCFVESFNLWKYVMNKWSKNGQCYLSTPDVPCDGPEMNDEGGIVNTEGDGAGKYHNKNAASGYQEYYRNNTVARLVTNLYLTDIARYHYPYWSQA